MGAMGAMEAAVVQESLVILMPDLLVRAAGFMGVVGVVV